MQDIKIGDPVVLDLRRDGYPDTVTYLVGIIENEMVENRYITVSLTNNNIQKYLNGEPYQVSSWAKVRRPDVEMTKEEFLSRIPDRYLEEICGVTKDFLKII